jgi:hypothetical protein
MSNQANVKAEKAFVSHTHVNVDAGSLVAAEVERRIEKASAGHSLADNATVAMVALHVVMVPLTHVPGPWIPLLNDIVVFWAAKAAVLAVVMSLLPTPASRGEASPPRLAATFAVCWCAGYAASRPFYSMGYRYLLEPNPWRGLLLSYVVNAVLYVGIVGLSRVSRS